MQNYSGGFIYTLCALTSMASLKVYTRQPLFQPNIVQKVVFWVTTIKLSQPWKFLWLSTASFCYLHTLIQRSQPPVKNILSSNGWNLRANTFLPCPSSGAKTPSSLQKPKTKNFVGYSTATPKISLLFQIFYFSFCLFTWVGLAKKLYTSIQLNIWLF